MFDDRVQYWRAETPAAGVKNPNTGTLIQVKSVSTRRLDHGSRGQTGRAK